MARRNPALPHRNAPSAHGWCISLLCASHFLALRLQDHNADSIPRWVTRATRWKVHEGYCAQVAGVEPKAIEEILAGNNCAATRERELIRGAVSLRISLNDDRSPDNRIAVLRKSVCQ